MKGFYELDTPSTGVTSLPTPHAEPPLLEVLETHHAVPESNSMLQIVFDEAPIPGAPRLRDLDSFTEGTAKGSFDSIPAASANEYGEPIPPITTLSLSLLPPQNTSLSIEMWRKAVHSYTPSESFDEVASIGTHDQHDSSPPNKRPRSLAADDENRRIRRRAQSDVSCSSSPVFFVEKNNPLPVIDTPHDNRHQLRRSHSLPPPD